MRFCGNCGTRLADAPLAEPSAPAAQPSAQQVGTLMGADLMERFRRAGLESAGQRRNVTILFVDISGYTQLSKRLGDEELYEFIRQYLDSLANDVYKYDGMVDKFTGDGLMALFGAPIAHENNAELALRAALDMHADVAELSQQLKERLGGELRVHIGLNSGSVIVGGVGSDLMMNYTAIGDTVNLAQRLDAGAEPGDTLVSASVYQATHMLFEYEPVTNLIPKGMTEPVPCYRLLKPKARPGSVRGVEGLRAPMIGRDAELRQLMQAIGALATYRQGQFILIVGEAGLGKSRLVGEIKSRTIPVSIIMLEGQSLTYRRAASYWIFQDLLRNYLHVTLETPAALVSERLRRNVTDVLEQRTSEVLPYLEHLLSLPPSDPDAARRI
jgi:class 3 adenylate cyclase